MESLVLSVMLRLFVGANDIIMGRMSCAKERCVIIKPGAMGKDS